MIDEWYYEIERDKRDPVVGRYTVYVYKNYRYVTLWCTWTKKGAHRKAKKIIRRHLNTGADERERFDYVD